MTEKDVKKVFNFCWLDQFNQEDLDERKLYLNSGVDEECIGSIAYHILRYNRIDKGIPVEERKPIILYINTPGGSVSDGWGLIDAIITSKTPVYTVNQGMCASMGFLIFIAGHKRFTMPHAEYLMHEGYTGIIDNMSKAKDRIDFEAGELETVTRQFVLNHTKISEEFYDKKYRCEFYFLPGEAKRLGVADYIVGTDCDMDEIV